MKQVEAGEMFGFKVINVFPESCTEDEWIDFADNMSRILKPKDEEKTVSA